METFFQELKNHRDKQEIDLSEVSNRTKINIRFLESIEAGDFSFLPHVYGRLFLRAYAIEIGADPEAALLNLENYLKQENDQSKSPENTFDDLMPGTEPDIIEPSVKSPFEMRMSVINVIILLAIIIFAIFIIRKITGDSSVETVNTEMLDINSDFPAELIESELAEN